MSKVIKRVPSTLLMGGLLVSSLVSFASVIDVPSAIKTACKDIPNLVNNSTTYKNIYLFDQNMGSKQINTCASAIANVQESQQFGREGYALLFKPSPNNYSQINFNVNYYTQVLGLGTTPEEVNFTDSTIQSLNRSSGQDKGHATQNFWRSIENISITPHAHNTMVWAVSQAAPLRKVNIHGNLKLSDPDPSTENWASGGFMANINVDEQLDFGTQQQWFSRNASFGSVTEIPSDFSVFFGDKNAPADNPSRSTAIISDAPKMSDKPSLVWHDDTFEIMVPAEKTRLIEAVHSSANAFISDIYFAQPSDTAVTINTAINKKKSIVFTPGTYDQLAGSIKPIAGTILLGIGIPQLLAPSTGEPIIELSDNIGNVRIGGLLLDANDATGNTTTDTLLKIGDTVNPEENTKETYLYDTYCRVGGVAWHGGKVNSCVTINSNNVTGDNLWLWRADHTDHVGWNKNTASNGLVVNGNNVSMYGLAVEHFQQYQTIWNGNHGQLYFYQSELPYDVANDDGLSSGSLWRSGKGGYASLEVGADVTSFQASGLGIYPYFTKRTEDNTLNSAILVKSDSQDIHFHSAMVWNIYGSKPVDVKSIIQGLHSNAGAPAINSNARSRLADWSPSTTPTVCPKLTSDAFKITYNANGNKYVNISLLAKQSNLSGDFKIYNFNNNIFLRSLANQDGALYPDTSTASASGSVFTYNVYYTCNNGEHHNVVLNTGK